MSEALVLAPREVAREQLRLITARCYDELADLYAEDAVVELPFSSPRLRIEGRGGVLARFRDLGERIELQVRQATVHDTLDPEVVVSEFDCHAYVPSTGRELDVTNVVIMRVRDGRIVCSRDFHDHAAFARAFAGQPA